MTLCIYEREPIGVDGALEALAVYYFCSDECRAAAKATAGREESNDLDGEEQPTMDGIVCEHCFKPLVS